MCERELQGSEAGLAHVSLMFSCQGLDRSGPTSGEVGKTSSSGHEGSQELLLALL